MIVVRRDLNMRRGKEAAQAAHASLNVVLGALDDPRIRPWLETGATKIVVSVDSEEELHAVHERARAAGLLTSLVRDAGRTEFGEPTWTAAAIGPDEAERVDAVTGELRLR